MSHESLQRQWGTSCSGTREWACALLVASCVCFLVVCIVAGLTAWHKATRLFLLMPLSSSAGQSHQCGFLWTGSLVPSEPRRLLHPHCAGARSGFAC